MATSKIAWNCRTHNKKRVFFTISISLKITKDIIKYSGVIITNKISLYPYHELRKTLLKTFQNSDIHIQMATA